MDAEADELSHEFSIFLEDLQGDIGPIDQDDLLEMQCIVCTRTFIPWIEVNEGLDTIGICTECKSFVLNDNETGMTVVDSLGTPRSRRSRHGSSESPESELSRLIGSARHNHDLQHDDDAPSIPRRTTYNYRNSTRRARWAHSDTDNESTDIIDSLFGETDSHISFNGYGGDSDASADGHSAIDRDILSPLDTESRMHTDTDIDPMHAGFDQWTSDNGSAASPQNGAWLSWRVGRAEFLTDTDEIDLSPFTGNSGDYMDAQGFEELLEQLAEADSSRRGAPPAATSSVRSLPRVIISKDHEKNGALVCAVCKDPFIIGSEAKQLPCLHLYHRSCILPWLRTRNSCPVCRFELPTDDTEYEELKHSNTRNDILEIVDESSSFESSDLRDEASEHELQTENPPETGNGGDRPGLRGAGHWILFAAAPIVAIVSIAIVTWVRSAMISARDHDMRYSRRFHGAGQ